MTGLIDPTDAPRMVTRQGIEFEQNAGLRRLVPAINALLRHRAIGRTTNMRYGVVRHPLGQLTDDTLQSQLTPSYTASRFLTLRHLVAAGSKPGMVSEIRGRQVRPTVA